MSMNQRISIYHIRFLRLYRVLVPALPCILFGTEIMEQVIATKTQTVLFIQTVVERSTQAHILHCRAVMAFFIEYLIVIDIGRQRIVCFILHYMRAIARVSRRETGKKLVTEYMVHSYRPDQVSPSPTKILSETLFISIFFPAEIAVASHVETQVKAGTVGERMVHFGIHVEEVVTTF